MYLERMSPTTGQLNSFGFTHSVSTNSISATFVNSDRFDGQFQIVYRFGTSNYVLSDIYDLVLCHDQLAFEIQEQVAENLEFSVNGVDLPLGKLLLPVLSPAENQNCYDVQSVEIYQTKASTQVHPDFKVYKFSKYLAFFEYTGANAVNLIQTLQFAVKVTMMGNKQIWLTQGGSVMITFNTFCNSTSNTITYPNDTIIYRPNGANFTPMTISEFKVADPKCWIKKVEFSQ